MNANDIIIDSCVTTFENFAYRAPLLDREIMRQRHLPSWNIEAELPLEQRFDLIALPVATRHINHQNEIWIRYSPLVSQVSYDDIFLIYTVETQTWETISAEIETDVYVRDVWVDQAGNIWGKTFWIIGSDELITEEIPAFAQFDEEQRRFIFIEDLPVIGNMLRGFYNNSAKIVFDQKNDIWMFNIDGGNIYRYDLSTLSSEFILSLDEAVIDVVASKEYIYYRIYLLPLDHNHLDRVIQNTLYRISIDTMILEKLDVPDEWPIYEGLYIDLEDRLWLGATGYRNHDGSWHLIHTETSMFFDLVDNGQISYVWGAARLIFQSSDGKMWFNRFLDTGGLVDGLAWYDPSTNEGCLITNQYTSIVEDANQQLWIVIDNVLYTHEIVTR